MTYLQSFFISFLFFFFNDTATTEIYTNLNTLSLHDALPIPSWPRPFYDTEPEHHWRSEEHTSELQSHSEISYAVFCLKKKKNQTKNTTNSQSSNNPHKHKHTQPL